MRDAFIKAQVLWGRGIDAPSGYKSSNRYVRKMADFLRLARWMGLIDPQSAKIAQAKRLGFAVFASIISMSGTLQSSSAGKGISNHRYKS